MSAPTTTGEVVEPPQSKASASGIWRAPTRPLAFSFGVGTLVVLALVLLAGASLTAGTFALGLSGVVLCLLLVGMHRIVEILGNPETGFSRSESVKETELSPLREERQRVLRAIKELDFDFSLGKLSEADYKSVVQPYRLRAVELNRELQDSGALHPQLRQELGLGLQKPQGNESETRGDASTEINEGTISSVEAELSRCEKCNTLNDLDARFCKSCGVTLAPTVEDEEPELDEDSQARDQTIEGGVETKDAPVDTPTGPEDEETPGLSETRNEGDEEEEKNEESSTA